MKKFRIRRYLVFAALCAAVAFAAASCSIQSVPGAWAPPSPAGTSSLDPSVPDSPSGGGAPSPDSGPSEQAVTPAASPSPSAREESLPSPLPSLTPPVSPEAPEPTVTVSALGPDDVWVMEARDVAFTDGMTALDALVAACESASVPLEVRGVGQTGYIVSIGDYAESPRGGLSGWVYKLNGVYMSVGLGSTALSEGDRVALYFTLDLGRDVRSRED